MKTPNPDHPIRNTLKHLALGAALGIALLAPASAAPPVTTGLKLHLDASQLSGLNDGDTVNTWTDMSGLANNATASGTPIYKTNVFNGQPVIRFNNVSGFTTANLSSQFPTAATVFIVTTINNDNVYTLVQSNPGADEWWRYDNGNSYPALFRGGRLDGYCAMPNSGSHVFAITSSASAWEMSINGASQSVKGGNYNSGGALTIGNGASSRNLNGDIAEVLIYSRALDATELNAVGYYLTGKYGLTTSYLPPPPPAAPTGLVATPLHLGVRLDWTASTEATGYEVYRGVETGVYGPTAIGTTTSATTYTDTTATTGGPYFYVVKAVNSSGASAASSEASASPSADPVDQTITFALGLTVTKTAVDAPFPDTASAFPSGLPVTYSSDNEAVATVNSNTGVVTLTGVLGTANIQAAVAADADFNAAQATQTLTVTKAMPVITWNEPDPIIVGTPLGSTQLNATSGGVAGSFVYTPDIGTVLEAGSHPLSVQFTPDEPALYDTPAAKQVTQIVNLPPWLNVNFSSATLAGLVGPAGGLGTTWNTIPLAAGTTSSLRNASNAVTTVGVTIGNGGGSWGSPSLVMLKDGIYVGNGGTGTVGITGLTASHKYDLYIGCYYANETRAKGSFSTTNATSTVGAQSCINGTDIGATWARGVNYVAFFNVVPDANNKITFTFTGTGGYAMVSGLQLVDYSPPEAPPTPTNLAATPYYAKVDLTWAPALGATSYKVKRATAINGTYTELTPAPSTTSFTDATVAAATTYYYKVAATNAGGDSADSDPVEATTWTEPHDQTITFDLGLSVSKPWNNSPFADGATATSGLPVTYSSDNETVATVDASGTVTLTGVLGTAGILADQPGDANFNVAPQVSQELTVTKATPVITWNEPAPITVGTALGSTQLNATSGGVIGNFVYTPDTGTELAHGSHDLSVQFTPTDSTLYDTPAAKQVTLFVSLPPWLNVNFTVDSETGLEGPIGGAGLTWNQVTTTASGSLVDSTGAPTLVGTSSSTGSIGGWGNPALTVLKAGYFQFGGGADFTVTISGLQAGGGYDMFVLTRSNGTGSESNFGTFRTSNTNASGDQVIDSRLAYNGTTWVEGQNYALFENIIADGTGQISFTSDGHDPNEIDPLDANSYRLMVNGLQLMQTSSPPVFTDWAAANGATGQTPEQDHDNDGVENGIEYFMGETGSSFTPMPGLDGDNKVTWTKDPAYQGTYEVQTSPDLATWTNVNPRPVPSGGTLSYPLPTGAPGGKSFVRLLVTPAP